MVYGYHRVSTKDQNLDRGIIGIEDFCKQKGFTLTRIYTDKISGKRFDRPRYTVLKEDTLRSGDTLILWELHRLGRNKAEIAKELSFFKEKGIRVMFLNVPTSTMDWGEVEGNNELSRKIIDTVNQILIEMLSLFAETEIMEKKKACDEGREAMKLRGEWGKYGRPRKISKEDFALQYSRVTGGEIRSNALMRELGLQRDTYFRYVKEYKMDNCI